MFSGNQVSKSLLRAVTFLLIKYHDWKPLNEERVYIAFLFQGQVHNGRLSRKLGDLVLATHRKERENRKWSEALNPCPGYVLPPARFCIRMVPLPPPTALPGGDPVSQYVSLRGTFLNGATSLLSSRDGLQRKRLQTKSPVVLMLQR